MPGMHGTGFGSDEIVIVGSGIAGLVCALSLAPRPVTLITKTPALSGGSSWLAKGGIAAALGKDDSPAQHAADTLAAGAGLSHPARARSLAEQGVRTLQFLVEAGVPFDRALDGSLELAREAAHRHPRVLHAGGDATGQLLINALIGRLADHPSIRILPDTFAVDLDVEDGEVRGIDAMDGRGVASRIPCRRVILATGGIGMTWWHTSNPPEATGDGLAMAARAGAALTDLEFVQFHPTALALEDHQAGASLPLLTEALRGAGATLHDRQGRRFMLQESDAAELATRDVVARAIHRRYLEGDRVFLDLRPVCEAGRDCEFPQAIAAIRAAGIDPAVERVPVIPAAHYHMGGVEVDTRGRTNVAGLWACGEVASTGIHGANRLASNSLLEGLVYARRVAADVGSARPADLRRRVTRAPVPMTVCASLPVARVRALHDLLRRTMSDHVSIERSQAGLDTARECLQALQYEAEALVADAAADAGSGERARQHAEFLNALTVARLVTIAAMQREESRGAHYRCDFPASSDEWRRRQRLTLGSLRARRSR